MGGPTSWATINFPVKMIDPELRKLLEEDCYVKFDEEGPLTDDFNSGGWIEVVDDILGLHETDLTDGEFADLEEMLVKKGIPFDRETGMEWEIAPEKRIFRPGKYSFLYENGDEHACKEPDFDHYYPLDSEGRMVVGVEEIRELLDLDDAGEMASNTIRVYLDKEFPNYPSLEDLVKEAKP